MRFATRPVALWFSAAATTSTFLPTSLGLVHPSVGAVSRNRSLALKSTSALRMSSSSTNSMKVALCQFHVTPDKEANHETAKSYLAKAKAGGADLVVLPEVCFSSLCFVPHLCIQAIDSFLDLEFTLCHSSFPRICGVATRSWGQRV